MRGKLPVRRTGTITRANVQMAMLRYQELDTAEKVADFLCGVGQGGYRFAGPRHVRRCERLMAPPPGERQEAS